MEFKITIDQFDGPLDLMLHLIKEGDLDLFDLDIVKLTDQYLDYIHQMERMHLDIASEYLSELATLIEYKSKKLLPNNNDELTDDYKQEDDPEMLVNRLIEYKKYKEVVSDFENLYQLRSLKYDKPQAEIASEWISLDQQFEETSPYQLIKAMEKVLKRVQLAQPMDVVITQKEITVEDRIKQIKKNIKSFPEVFTMEKTMEDCHDLNSVVVTFLSLLDLVHDGYLNFSIKQDVVYFVRGNNYGK